MKILLSLSFFILLHTLLAQEVKYVPVFLDACDSSQVESKSRYVTEFDVKEPIKNHLFYQYIDSTRAEYYSFENDTVTLADTGRYNFSVRGLPYSNQLEVQIPIHIRKYGVNRDTFYIPRLLPKVIDSSKSKYGYRHKVRFMNCDALANGFLESYYYDGRLRLAGNFKKGKMTDSLKEYYFSSGDLSKKYVKEDRQFTTYEYDRDGNESSKDIYSRGLFKLRGKQKNYEYDSLKSMRRWVKWRIVPTKTLKYNHKLERIEKELYSKSVQFWNDNKKVKLLSRRRRYFQGNYGYEKGVIYEKDYRFKLKLYDKEGNRLLKFKFDKMDYKFTDLKEDHKDYRYYNLAVLKSYKANKKYSRIKWIYDKTRGGFIYMQYKRKGLRWEADKELIQEEIILMIKQIEGQTNAHLISR